MVQKVVKILEKLLYIILIILIFIFGYYIIQRLVNKDQPAKLFGYYMFEVSSWSMYNEEDKDSLAKGDLIFVKKRKKSDYDVGMTVTYDLGKGMPTTHRIIAIDEDVVITQGINKEGNTSPDAPFDKKYIIGEVKFVWHNYREFMNFITSPLGIIIIMGVGFILIEGFSLIKKKTIKKDSRKNEELN